MSNVFYRPRRKITAKSLQCTSIETSMWSMIIVAVMIIFGSEWVILFWKVSHSVFYRLKIQKIVSVAFWGFHSYLITYLLIFCFRKNIWLSLRLKMVNLNVSKLNQTFQKIYGKHQNCRFHHETTWFLTHNDTAGWR